MISPLSRRRNAECAETDRLSVLIAHVRYRHAGGEDSVVEAEAALLRQAGHDVTVYVSQSDEFDAFPLTAKLSLATRFHDHPYGRGLVRQLVDQHRPDIVHFHNIYPLFGPGGMAEASRLGCAVVQTLHNYRLSCLNGRHFLLDQGVPCTRCRPRSFGPGLIRACYRDSRMQSMFMAAGLSAQWRQLVTAGLPHVSFAVSEFLRDWMLAHGAPEGRVVVKPNSVDEGAPEPTERHEAVVFVGRLSREKGVVDLIEAWPADAPQLVVIGDGPLYGSVVAAAGANVHVLGSQPPHQVRRFLRSARVCAMPSLCFEGCPVVVLEALAEGTPAVAFSDTAAAAALSKIDPRLCVEFGDMTAFVERCRSTSRSPDWTRLSAACRGAHAQSYTHEASLAGLLQGYNLALARASGSVPRDASCFPP